MELKILNCNKKNLKEYSKIPITFKIDRKFEVKLINKGIGGILLKETKLKKTYIKDYDKLYNPLSWLKDFDIKKWKLILAYKDKKPVGGAILVHKDKRLWHLERRDDLAFLWDIRVHPNYRGKKIGEKIFKEVINLAKKKRCKQLKIETKNTNVSACKFYVKQNCELGEIHRYKYIQNPKVKKDVMLTWYYNIK